MEKRTIPQLAEFLQGKLEAPVFVDRPALDAVGVDPKKTLVTGNFRDISLRSALAHLLHGSELTWAIRDGALVITTPEKAEEALLTEVYQVRDLVLPRESLAGDPSWSDFRSPFPFTFTARSVYDHDTLMCLIESIVSPESWPSGGPGHIQPFHDTLTFSQTAEVHRQVRQLFAALREAEKIRREYGAGTPPVVSIHLDAASNRPIYQSLQSNMMFDFVETPLKQVASFLQERLRVLVVVDHVALDAVGVSERVPITFSSRGLAVGQSLRHMLRDHNLTWSVRDEALMITTPEKAEEDLDVRVYPVADLLNVPDPGRQRPLLPGGGDFNDLIALLESIVDPASWEGVGGPGVLERFPPASVLVINQRPEVHEEIEQLLSRLRAGLAAQRPETNARAEEASAGVQRRRPPTVEGPSDDAGQNKLFFEVYFVQSPADAPPPKAESAKKIEGADAAAPAEKSSSAGETPRQIARQVGSGPGCGAWRHPPIPEARLLEIVQELVEPESWKTMKGVYARAVPGRLIIRHTLDVHQKINCLLQRLGSSSGGFGGGFGGMGQIPGSPWLPGGMPTAGFFSAHP